MNNYGKINDCAYIRRLIDKSTPVSIYTCNGFKMSGTIVAHDEIAVVLVDNDGDQQYIFLNAISTISPGKNISMDW